MALGTIDRTPPPFFRQGPSALTKLAFCSTLALFLMVADTRFQMTAPLRAAIATVLHPIERTLLVPVQLWQGGSDYLRGLHEAQAAETDARKQLTLQSEIAAQVEPLQSENARLRSLLGLRPRLSVRHQAAEVLYVAADPYSRKIVVDRGLQHGVAEGAPAINEQGVLGQVTRVYPLSAEITLLTDKDAAIPVLNVRTQQRGAAFGVSSSTGLSGSLELRFMAANADVQVGDLLTTSGMDGVYPAGLPVAKITTIERKAQTNFARITLTPVAPTDNLRYLLLLEPVGHQMPARAEAPAPEVKPNKKATKR